MEIRHSDCLVDAIDQTKNLTDIYLSLCAALESNTSDSFPTYMTLIRGQFIYVHHSSKHLTSINVIHLYILYMSTRGIILMNECGHLQYMVVCLVYLFCVWLSMVQGWNLAFWADHLLVGSGLDTSWHDLVQPMYIPIGYWQSQITRNHLVKHTTLLTSLQWNIGYHTSRGLRS